MIVDVGTGVLIALGLPGTIATVAGGVLAARNWQKRDIRAIVTDVVTTALEGPPGKPEEGVVAKLDARSAARVEGFNKKLDMHAEKLAGVLEMTSEITVAVQAQNGKVADLRESVARLEGVREGREQARRELTP